MTKQTVLVVGASRGLGLALPMNGWGVARR